MQDIKPILEKALTHLSAGKMSAAIAQCKKALHKAPNNFDALHLFGVALLKSKRHTEASQALTKAVSQQAPNRQKAMAYSNLSLSQLYAGFSHKALESIDNSLGLAPQSPESLANRIIILESIERWDALLATYDRLARLQPPPPALRLSR
ncbi:MAG: tetratricopeptide repeat protein, partial [Pontibacterium sp.]